MSVTIPTALRQNSVFKTQIASILESMRAYSPITTIIRARAKQIDIPTLTVSNAKTHGLESMTSVGTATPGNETFDIDTRTDNSVNYNESDFLGDEFGFKKATKESLLRGIQAKINDNFTTNVLAGATAVTGTVDLSTQALVTSFLSDVGALARRNYFSWKPRVEHGTVVKAKYEGKAFVIAGAAAFKKIQVAYDTYLLTATGKADNYDNMFKAPGGVWVIDAGDAFADTNQLVYGIAGAPIHAYREDKIEEFDDKITTRTVAGSISGDLSAADETVQRDYNMGGGIWEKAGVPTTVAAYVKKQLAAA